MGDLLYEGLSEKHNPLVNSEIDRPKALRMLCGAFEEGFNVGQVMNKYEAGKFGIDKYLDEEIEFVKWFLAGVDAVGYAEKDEALGAYIEIRSAGLE